MLTAFADLVIRRAKAILVTAVVIVALGGVVGSLALGKLKSGGFQDPSAQSTQAQNLIDSAFGGQADLILLVHAKAGTVDDPAVAATGGRLTRSLVGDPRVTSVESYWRQRSLALRSTDGTHALITMHVLGDDSQAGRTSKALIDQYTRGDSLVSVQASGKEAVKISVNSEVTDSLALAEAIAVPITAILLILTFGSVVAAALPLAIGLTAILGTFAELFVLGSITDVSVFALNLTTALGLGLGVDYALLLVARYREQLASGAATHEAVVDTVRTAGRTILFSALIVTAALAALLLFPLYFLRSFAYAGIGVVAIAAASALIIIPALLALLGPKVNAGKLPWSKADRGSAAPFWGRLASRVMKRPLLTGVPVVALLLLLASSLLHSSFGTPDEQVLRPGTMVRDTAETLNSDFTGNQATAIHVLGLGKPGAAADTAFAERLRTMPGVKAVATIPATSPSTDATLFHILTTLAPHSAEAQSLAADIRALPGPNGESTLTGGETAMLIDTKHAIASRMPLAVGLVALTTLLIMFLFTGSVAQPLRALVLNSLSITSAIGVMVWVFQDGHLAGPLDFTARPMDMSMTVLLFCIAFGLSMDYEVFVTSRIKELHDRGAPVADAVCHGLSHTGRIVSSAAVLLAISFFAFGTATISFLQMLGLGCGLAILIDALLVRGVLVPATMRLLGPAAWWAPGPLRRLHRRIGLSEAGDEPAVAQPQHKPVVTATSEI
ncbi:MMPL family transporter [Streptomyces subrutilus]|uniref:MMPL family transporter n=1 Tax=Streptomyces subrutilus TaxID=36818 RepID=UPI00340718B8